MLKDASPGQSAAAVNYLLAFDSIGGWLSIDTAFAMIELAWEQTRIGLDPGMAEIGVHYGKSFLALLCGATPGGELIAIDVFERQDLNIDRSGEGNTEYFLASVARFFPGVTPRLIAAPSETLRGELAGARGRLADAEAGRAALEADAAAQACARDAAQRDAAALRASTSWRVTAPPRAVSRLVGKGR